jgi:hypothetical protein
MQQWPMAFGSLFARPTVVSQLFTCLWRLPCPLFRVNVHRAVWVAPEARLTNYEASSLATSFASSVRGVITLMSSFSAG